VDILRKVIFVTVVNGDVVKRKPFAGMTLGDEVAQPCEMVIKPPLTEGAAYLLEPIPIFGLFARYFCFERFDIIFTEGKSEFVPEQKMGIAG